MSDDEDSNRPLEAHGMVMKHDFMRAAGLSEQQFNRLQAEGLIEVFCRRPRETARRRPRSCPLADMRTAR